MKWRNVKNIKTVRDRVTLIKAWNAYSQLNVVRVTQHPNPKRYISYYNTQTHVYAYTHKRLQQHIVLRMRMRITENIIINLPSRTCSTKSGLILRCILHVVRIHCSIFAVIEATLNRKLFKWSIRAGELGAPNTLTEKNGKEYFPSVTRRLQYYKLLRRIAHNNKGEPSAATNNCDWMIRRIWLWQYIWQKKEKRNQLDRPIRIRKKHSFIDLSALFFVPHRLAFITTPCLAFVVMLWQLFYSISRHAVPVDRCWTNSDAASHQHHRHTQL